MPSRLSRRLLPRLPPRLLKSLALALATALFFAAWLTAIPERPLPQFERLRPPDTVREASPLYSPKYSPLYREGWISRGETNEAHSANLAMHGGELIATWYGGTEEGAADVALFTSRFRQDEWTSPQRVMDRPQAQADLSRSIRKLGNPVLHSWDDSRLGLFFVTVSIGGWAGSSINYMEATAAEGDALAWGPARRLVTSPFINISTLVRHTGLALEDGALLLPVYHEFLGKFAETLTISPALDVLGKARLSRGTHALQPAVAPTSETAAIAMLRHSGSPPNRLMRTDTPDGLHWRAPQKTRLPNPNAAVALINIGSGELLLACNDTEDGRHRLALLTKDISAAGNDWTFRHHVEMAPGKEPAAEGKGFEFSYPSLALDGRGVIHLAYTWNKKRIKHVAFNRAWLTGS